VDVHQQNRRMHVVDDHIAHETAHRLEPLVATFGANPEWHDKAGGNVMTGAASIHDFYAALFRAFPDFWLDVQRKHSAAGAIVVEGDLGGTHRAEWQGIPATGKSVRIPFCAVFTFDANDSIQAEIVYFDRLSMLIQLGVMNQTA